MTTPSAAAAPALPGDRNTLEDFLGRLLERWQEAAPPTARENQDQPLAALELAEAALRLSGSNGRPVQVAVVGPTQTGKSTVVNLLLGRNSAGVSPLAGYTIHAQGFSRGDDGDEAWLARTFPRFTRRRAGETSREEIAAYTFQKLDSGSPAGPPQVVWDTPDFDSLASADYRRAVLECAALADVQVLVVSKEKYADLSVWRFLELVAPLRTPLVVVLNKLTEDAAATIHAAVERRLAELATAPAAIRLVALPLSAALRATGEGMDRGAILGLRESVAQLVEFAATRRTRSFAGPLRLVRRGWEEWTAPLVAQQRVWRDWETIVAGEVKTAAAAYERDFLDHPQRYDTFRRATLELLRMVELPVIGGALGQARELVSGVARSAWSLGRRLLARSPSERREPPNAERLVLENVIDRCLFGAAREALRRCRGEGAAAAAWQAISERLEHDEAAQRERFLEAAAAAQIGFGHEIHAAADRLLSLLKQRPGLLNTLRAARATTDVASIALAIKTGGTPVHDLLLAPALFGFTSLLTEGALGKYMASVAQDLRIRQLSHMCRSVFDQPMGAELAAIPRTLEGPRLFGALTGDLDAAAAALDRLTAEVRE